MKAVATVILSSLLFFVLSCSKDKKEVQTFPIPNNDFETWDIMGLPGNWETNSCMACTPPYETYIVRKDSTSSSGQFAAKFIYNNVYPAYAESKFSVQGHPSGLMSYVKCNLAATDTVSILVKLFYNNVVIDSGQWLGTSSVANFISLSIPITQNNANADSVLIRIQGGNKNASPNNNTEFWVDNLSLQ